MARKFGQNSLENLSDLTGTQLPEITVYQTSEENVVKMFKPLDTTRKHTAPKLGGKG